MKHQPEVGVAWWRLYVLATCHVHAALTNECTWQKPSALSCNSDSQEWHQYIIDLSIFVLWNCDICLISDLGILLRIILWYVWHNRNPVMDNAAHLWHLQRRGRLWQQNMGSGWNIKSPHTRVARYYMHFYCLNLFKKMSHSQNVLDTDARINDFTNNQNYCWTHMR